MSEQVEQVVEQSQTTEPTPEVSKTPEGSSEPKTEVNAESPEEVKVEAVKEAVKEGATKEEVEEMIDELELKVDGKTFKEKLPFKIPKKFAADLIKEKQLAKMAQNRAQEAAELRKKDLQREQDIEQIMKIIKGDPEGLLKYGGHDIKKFAEEILAKQVEEMEMTEEQKEIKRLQEALKEKEDAEKAAKERAEQVELEALREKFAAEYEKDLVDAFDSVGMKRNAEVTARMNSYLRLGLKNGINLKYKDIIPLVKESIENDLKTLVATKGEEELETMLGEEMIKKMIKRQAKKKVAPDTASNIKDTATKKTEEKPKERHIPQRDFFNKI